MSNVQTSAERSPCDLDHFVYSTGMLGRLKTLSCIPVVAGDSISIDAVGAFRLSPFRRGLSVDSNVDVFTFYVPYRHIYGDEWVTLLKDGIPPSGTIPVLSAENVPSSTNDCPIDQVGSYVATRVNQATNLMPKYLHGSYMRIWNNYFKNPYEPDSTYTPATLPKAAVKDGMVCAHLESIWTKPLNPNAQTTQKFADMAGNDGIDIIGLNLAYGKLHTQQEREHFMSRYREVISSFGGSTSYDADSRPHLLMRSNFWASGYDTDGTTQETLGQFSGRVQQPFSHHVPRFYVPEHGVIMTLMLVRFPVIHEKEMHTFVGRAVLDYNSVACDPAIIANHQSDAIQVRELFSGSGSTSPIRVPAAQWYRFHPSYVDYRYSKLLGFPFLTSIPAAGGDAGSYITPEDYDKCFQTTQLGHWNIQSKFNVSVMRHIPSARDSIMTS